MSDGYVFCSGRIGGDGDVSMAVTRLVDYGDLRDRYHLALQLLREERERSEQLRAEADRLRVMLRQTLSAEVERLRGLLR